jgi:hypothetical protein
LTQEVSADFFGVILDLNVGVEFLQLGYRGLGSAILADILFSQVEVGPQVFDLSQGVVLDYNFVRTCQYQVFGNLDTQTSQSVDENFHLYQFSH